MDTCSLCPSSNSLTLKNCAIVVINPADKFKNPINNGTYTAQLMEKILEQNWQSL